MKFTLHRSFPAFSFGFSLFLSFFFVVLVGSPAAAACTSLPSQNVEATDGNHHTVKGTHGIIYVNSFDNAPSCPEVRSLVVYPNTGTDFVETGWANLQDGGGNRVFFTWQNNGVLQPSHYPGQTPASGSDVHDWKIVNSNGNNCWAFDYDDAYLNSGCTTFSVGHNAVTNSEIHRSPSGDSLWAHFHGLRTCTLGDCSDLNPWGNDNTFYNDSHDPIYRNCPNALDNREIHVKESC